MISNEQSIAKLKQLVIQSRDLREPLNYFFDLMDNKVLINMKGHREVGQPQNNVELLAVIGAVENEINRCLGHKIRVVGPIFHELPAHHFFHGLCLSREFAIPLTVLYFSDVQTGIFNAVGGMNQNDMFRFALVKKADLNETH